VADKKVTLRDVLAQEIAAIEDGKPCMVTGFVCIVEYVDPGGNLQIATVDDQDSPYWRTAGLLAAADNIYSYDTDEEVEDE